MGEKAAVGLTSEEKYKALDWGEILVLRIVG